MASRTVPRSESLGLGRYAVFLLLGMYFGVVLMKAEVVSWYRIQEMFRFQSFHMYGVIGSAVLVGMVSVWLIKRFKVRTFGGDAITLSPKDPTYRRYIFGGTIFGLGWAMTGACPGPIAALIGSGQTVFVVVLVSAILGTYVYGLLQKRLPH
jgi:uncharacterized membrane protein YedE/YeeE